MDDVIYFNEPPPDILSKKWKKSLDDAMRARKLSPRTRSLYTYYNTLLCRKTKITPENMQPEDITKFLAGMEKSKKYSAASLNLAISAIKFFYRNVLRLNNINEQKRPRNDVKLPVVLSKEEVNRLIEMEKNAKNRLLLVLCYSSGLRVSEVVALKKEHIDLLRKLIIVKQGKGRKDRMTLLSEKAASFVAEYIKVCKIKDWIFPGRVKTNHISIRTAQRVFDEAAARAGVNKEAAIHSLRHSFATHLLEGGTDILYIKTLLGHSSIRSTERYIHVAKLKVLSVKSPFDD